MITNSWPTIGNYEDDYNKYGVSSKNWKIPNHQVSTIDNVIYDPSFHMIINPDPNSPDKPNFGKHENELCLVIGGNVEVLEKIELKIKDTPPGITDWTYD